MRIAVVAPSCTLKREAADAVQALVARRGDCEVAIHNRVVIAASKCRPRIDAHVLVDCDVVHFCRATNREFYHAIF